MGTPIHPPHLSTQTCTQPICMYYMLCSACTARGMNTPAEQVESPFACMLHLKTLLNKPLDIGMEAAFQPFQVVALKASIAFLQSADRRRQSCMTV